MEYNDNFSKASGISWQYYRNEPAINDAGGAIVYFTADYATTNSFKLKEKITGKTGNNGTKHFTMMISLKYLSNFCRTLKMLLIISEINVDLNLSKNWVIVSNNANQATTFSITDTKNVPALTLLTQENENVLNNSNLVLKEQLTRININQKYLMQNFMFQL